jgi:hypothetical protein
MREDGPGRRTEDDGRIGAVRHLLAGADLVTRDQSARRWSWITRVHDPHVRRCHPTERVHGEAGVVALACDDGELARRRTGGTDKHSQARQHARHAGSAEAPTSHERLLHSTATECCDPGSPTLLDESPGNQAPSREELAAICEESVSCNPFDRPKLGLSHRSERSADLRQVTLVQDVPARVDDAQLGRTAFERLGQRLEVPVPPGERARDLVVRDLQGAAEAQQRRIGP